MQHSTPPTSHLSLILLAGGSGQRMQHAVEDKVLTRIGQHSVFAHCCSAFNAAGIVDSAVVVCRDAQQQAAIAECLPALKLDFPLTFTFGGLTRQNSVANGLGCLPKDCSHVLIHDCARPAVRPQAIRALAHALQSGAPAATLAHRVVDTLRRYSADPLAAPADGTLVERDCLWAMETPQGFARDAIERAHSQLDVSVTDDVEACRRIGICAQIVESTHPNPKLTTPADLPLLNALLTPPTQLPMHAPRIGFGYDIHRTVKGRALVLACTPIPSDFGLDGHSDADVIAHAVADAILGACGASDIGHFFPNDSAACKDMDSALIIAKAVAVAAENGLQLSNVDVTLIAEAPKIAPFLHAMKQNLAAACQITPSQLAIKATTNERLGSLGAQRGMAAHAVACLYPINTR